MAEPVPENCPGTSSEEAGKAAACAGCPNQSICATAPKGPDPDMAAIAQRMSGVKHKILVLSGKGGVGKSTFSAQLAFALAAQGKEVGLLDIDICGPSIPKMLGLEGQEIHQSNAGWSPVYVEDNLAVMSIGFMLPNPDEAVIWRGPRKNGLIKQFLKDVDWGPLDYLVVDAPPGTSDEHITIAQCLRAAAAEGDEHGGGTADDSMDGAVIVTTPQEVSIADVRKEISFCKKVGLRMLGVVENMSGLQQRVGEVRFVQQASSGSTAPPADVTEQVLALLEQHFPGARRQMIASTDVFQATRGGAARLCEETGVPLLGRVPLDPRLGRLAEEGRSAFEADADQPSSKSLALGPLLCLPALRSIVEQVLAATGERGSVGAAGDNGC